MNGKHKFLISALALFVTGTTACTVVVSGEPFDDSPPATSAANAAAAPALPAQLPAPLPSATPTSPPATNTPTPEPPTATPSPTPSIQAMAPALLPTSTQPAGEPVAPPVIPATATPVPSPTPPPTATPIPATPTSAAAMQVAQPPARITSDMPPTVKEATLTIPTFGYQQALVATADDDPVYPYPRLDANKVGPPVATTYRAIILENRYTQLTILPELGGRIYRWIDKSTGRNLFYENPVIKPTTWGYRGWWLATGGMEWALPTDEHGLSEASPWQATPYQNPAEAGVTLTDTEENSGLVSEINIALDAEHAYFTLTPRIINPTDQPVTYKFWINGMFNLGQPDPRDGTEFILPGSEVTIHSTGDPSLPGEGEKISWPNFNGRDLSNYSSWQNYLGVFAAPAAQADFMGAYNHKSNVGVARVFPHQLARGAKIFAPGNLDPALWTTDNSSYFELWGGLAPTFWDTTALEPGAWVTWQERWYAVGDMGGFSAANAEAALNLGVLPDSVQIAAASTHPVDGYLILWHNQEEASRWPVTLYPESPLRSSFTAAGTKGGEWGLSLFEKTGRLVAELGNTLPELPAPGQPEVIPAAVNLPALTPTATTAPPPAPAATPTADAPEEIPTAAPPAVVTVTWDSRLSDADVKLIPASEEPEQDVFRLVSAKYLNEWEAQGLHHVFVEVLDEQGRRIVGQPVMLSWRDGKTPMVTEDKPAPEFAANAPLYGSKDDGTYKVYVDGAPSDIVTGLGLPAKHHVSYQLTFQRNVKTSRISETSPTPQSTAMPTSTPVPPPASGGSSTKKGGASWDPRLDDLGIKLKPGQPKDGVVFRLVSAKYQDDSQSSGMHHVFVEVLDEQGKRIVGQPVVMAWADGKNVLVTENKPTPEFAANAPMYGPMDKGTYSVYVDGAPSDEISGLGLPGNHHVNYLLTFQRKKE